MNNVTENPLKHFLNVGLGTAINMLLGFITTPLITRIVDPSVYGELNVFNAYADIALAICFVGLDKGLVRFFYDCKTDDKKIGLIKECFIVPLVSSAVVFFIYLLLIRINIVSCVFENYVLYLLLSYVLVSIWNRISVLLLRLTFNSKKYSVCSVIQKIVYCLIIINYYLMINKNHLLMLILALMISISFASLYATLCTKDYWHLFTLGTKPENIKEVFKYSMPFMVYSTMDALLDSIDKLSLDTLCTEYDVGIYSAGLSLVAIFALVKTIFDTMWVPMQTEHYTNNPEDRSFFQKGSRYISIIMFFVGANFILFKDLICYILGAKYREASIVLPFLFIGNVFYSISDTTVIGIDYSKKSYLQAIISVSTALCNAILNVVLIPKIGIIGASLATLISYSFFLISRTYFSVKLYYVNYGIRKILIVSISLVAFAIVSTFYSSVLLNIVFYTISMIVLLLNYKNDIESLVRYVYESIRNIM